MTTLSFQHIMSASSPDPSAPWSASIVVPAHNEASRGFVTLDLLGRAIGELNCLVIIVCNGCNDSTSAMARSLPRVVVLDVETASKSNALNLGDDAAGDVFPRIYLDADVEMTLESLHELLTAVGDDAPVAAGPEVTYAAAKSGRIVRNYFEAVQRLPFLVAIGGQHLEGRGAYAVSRTGRSRFDKFPELLADDAFFDRMFDKGEKRVVRTSMARLSVPSRTRDLLRSQVRMARGSRELHAWLISTHPERLVVSGAQSDPRSSVWGRLRAHARTGIVIPGGGPHGVELSLTYLMVEAAARVGASLSLHLGRTVSWR